MPDIFISYSRKDSEQAIELAEKLRASGMAVWLDQYGIEAASNWSGEIVEAIWSCKAFVLLLSKSSLNSDNVVKELSIASEKKKPIIPLEFGAVELTKDFAYQLAGLQRVALSDFNAILRSLKKLGINRMDYSADLTLSPSVKPFDPRKSLIVLPFEDLSPSGEDNGWFADGLAGELIDAFGHIKSLRVLDRKTSIALRNTKLRTVEIGKEFNTRYFIEGSVRKFGEQIKISVALLDIETGDYLWQESHRGEFKDIFDIQEAMAEMVVEGLKLHLTKEEKNLVDERGTENAEAYELFLKAGQYFASNIKEGFQSAIDFYSQVIKLDPNYVNAYASKANALANLYRVYDPDPALLDDGMNLITEALRLKPHLWMAYGPLSFILQLRGKYEEAERTANDYIRNAPEDFMSHFALAFLYGNTGKPAKAIAPYEQTLKLKPEYLHALWNIVLCSNQANEDGKQRHWSEVAIPIFERHLQLFPHDEPNRVNHAALLHFVGRDDESKEAARKLENLSDGNALYNTACLQCLIKDYEAGLRTFRKAIENGYRNIESLNNFLNDEKEGVATLKNTPEYDEVKQIMEKIESEQFASKLSEP
jgi:adenylate cyclase